MTKPLLTVIAVVLALALGLVAGVVIGRESVAVSDSGAIEGVEPASNAAPVTVETEEGSAGGETQSLLPEARPAPQPLPATVQGSKIEGLAFDGAAHLAQLPWQLDTLAQRAEAGNAAALVEVADWLIFCEEAQRVESLGPASPFARFGDVALSDVRSWLVGVAQECKRWRQRHVLLRDAERAAAAARVALREHREGGQPASYEYVQAGSDAGQLLRRAADAGNAGALAAVRDPEVSLQCDPKSPEFEPLDPRDRGIAVQRCIDDQRLRIMERLLADRDPRAIEAAPDLLGFQGLQPMRALLPLNLTERKVLWTLAACAFGLDCGPTGPALRLACARGSCGFPSYRAYAGDVLLPPAAMRRVDRLVPELVRLIQAGNWAAILNG